MFDYLTTHPEALILIAIIIVAISVGLIITCCKSSADLRYDHPEVKVCSTCGRNPRNGGIYGDPCRHCLESKPMYSHWKPIK